MIAGVQLPLNEEMGKAPFPISCPVCSTPLIPLANGDGHCANCARDWFKAQVDGYACLKSRKRRVTVFLPELLKEGGDLTKAIRPAPIDFSFLLNAPPSQ